MLNIQTLTTQEGSSKAETLPFNKSEDSFLPFYKIENGNRTKVLLPRNSSTLEAFYSYTPTCFEIPNLEKLGRSITDSGLVAKDFFHLSDCYEQLNAFEQQFCPSLLPFKLVTKDAAVIIKQDELTLINNLEYIEKVVRLAFDRMNNGTGEKAKPHISVEGYVRTGKSTISTFVIPYLYSRLMIDSQNKSHDFKHYRTIVLDPSVFKGKDTFKFIFKKIDASFPFSFNFKTCFETSVLEALRVLNYYRVFLFLVVDEIQLLDDTSMRTIKYFTKSTARSNNFLPILTGSTQSMVTGLFSRIPANGFSIYDNYIPLRIPKICSKQSINDCLGFIKATRQFEFTFKELSKVEQCGLLHYSYLKEMASGYPEKDLDQIMLDLIDIIFTIYARDFSFFLESGSDILKEIMSSVPTLTSIIDNTFITNKSIILEAYFVQENDRWIFKDVLLMDFLQRYYEVVDNKIEKKKSPVKNCSLIQFLLLSFVRVGELVKHDSNALDELFNSYSTIINPLSLGEVASELNKIDPNHQIRHSDTPKIMFKHILCFLRNDLSHAFHFQEVYKILVDWAGSQRQFTQIIESNNKLFTVTPNL